MDEDNKESARFASGSSKSLDSEEKRKNYRNKRFGFGRDNYENKYGDECSQKLHYLNSGENTDEYSNDD
jgi:hypothetical protein